MKILFISFYFPPDLSAGSFRSSSLVKELQRQLPKSGKIHIFSSTPNRYASYKTKALGVENDSNIFIHRIKVPKHKSGFFDQCKLFFYFAKSVILLTSRKEYDLVYATTGRLMSAVLGAYIANKLNKPLYLDIRDILIDTLKEFLPKIIFKILEPILSFLENYAINSATKINLVSPGFYEYFKKKYPLKNFTFYTNGIDNEFLKAKTKLSVSNLSKKLIVLYAGNIGEGQGLEKIIPRLASYYEEQMCFKIIGDGRRRDILEKKINKIGCKNVIFENPLKREDLIKLYNECDLLFVHLNNYEAFTKVIPSKLFEYAATGKPIWAGVAGYASCFILKNIPNAVVFSPGNLDQAIKSFSDLELRVKSRKIFKSKFARSKIMNEMAKDILSIR